MQDFTDQRDEQDQSEAFDEDNFDALESGVEANEFRTFEELPEVEDLTSTVDDYDDDDLIGDGDTDRDARQRDLDATADEDVEVADEDGSAAGDEVELVYAGLMRDARGAQASAAHWESRRLADDDIDDLGYGPDETEERA